MSTLNDLICSSQHSLSSSSSRSSSPVPSSPSSDLIPTDSEEEGLRQNPLASSSRKRKRVRISEAAPSVMLLSSLSNDALSEDELARSWWSATDFAEVKESLKQECKLYRQNRQYSDCLTDAYNRACDMADHLQVDGSNEHRIKRVKSCQSVSQRTTVTNESSLLTPPTEVRRTKHIYVFLAIETILPVIFLLKKIRVCFDGSRIKVPAGWKAILVECMRSDANGICKKQNKRFYLNRLDNVFYRPANGVWNCWHIIRLPPVDEQEPLRNC